MNKHADATHYVYENEFYKTKRFIKQNGGMGWLYWNEWAAGWYYYDPRTYGMPIPL